MGLISNLLGNASATSVDAVRERVGAILLPGEPVDLAFKVFRDLIVFTDRRLILIDVQGVSGKKVSYHTIPFKSIVDFFVETAGRFDTDSELIIRISGGQAIRKEFKKGSDIIAVQQALAVAVVGSGASSDPLWRVEGVDGDGRSSLITVTATSEEEAVGIANSRGLMVSSCSRA